MMILGFIAGRKPRTQRRGTVVCDWARFFRERYGRIGYTTGVMA
jgi:hypothetical protein